MELIDRVVEYLHLGGWIMLPLAGVSLAMWTLIIERVLVLGRLSSRDVDLGRAIAAVETGVGSGRPDDRGAHAGLRGRLLDDFLAERTGDLGLDREILHQCARRQRPELHRGLAAIGVLAAVAPLLGLLGTVLGMIRTFDVIAIFGTGNAKALAGGVSVALVTTQTGLLVAIPGLLSGAALRRQAARLERRLLEVTTILDRHLRSPGPGTGARG